MTTELATETEATPRRRRTFGLVLRALQVRLRFIVVLIVAFVVAGQWEVLRNHWEKLTRVLAGGRGHAPAVSAGTEYFCPMDPGVVSEWPGKCGICNMALVRRQVGDAAPLPSGALARMQFTPYRVQLAGIRTTPVAYEPLAREVSLVGVVTDGTPPAIEAELYERDRQYVFEGQTAELVPIGAMGQPPLVGKVLALIAGRRRAVIEVDDTGQALAPGMAVEARIRRPVAELEPFRSLPSDPPRIRKGELRALYLCPEHPEVVADARGRCPVDHKNDLERQALLDNQRVAWWCPMHPKVTADRAGAQCSACGGMALVPRVVTYRPRGQVLVVPESAVVDTGTRTVVFVERMPGMYDGVEVGLGPRCGDLYPVAKGLEPGQRVATAGAFLIDAETRLNPSLAASYFGSGRTSRSDEAKSEPASVLSGLSVEDQALAAKQKVCPVTGKPLGSMGTPVRVVVAGKTVLVCCEGCEERLRKKVP
jgi:hypothetical protein